MRKEEINEEVADVIDDGSTGVGTSSAKEEKKPSIWQRIWNWIKKFLGL